MTYFRIDAADRDHTWMLDPAQQVSYGWVGDEERSARAGVSCCGSIEDLAVYFGTTGGDLSGDRVIVELEGTRSADRPLDAELGEYLVHPTRIASVIDLDDAADFWPVYNRKAEETFGC